MDDSDLLNFTPVPLRARRDGWTAKKQYFFILGLARGFTAGRAAALLGLTRKTAYELRRRPGGEGFAAAWDAAVARARARRFEAKAASLAERGLHGEWTPRLHRGRLTGWTHRATSVGLTRLLNRLDKMAERLPPGTDTAYVDRYLASLLVERDSLDANSPPERGCCHVPRNQFPPSSSEH